MSTGKSFLTLSNISDAVFTLIIFRSKISLKSIGPDTKVVFTPALLKALAISKPCFPLDSFEINLTGSIYSLVGPVVTNAFNFFLITKSLFLK